MQLYDYQQQHFERLLHIFSKHQVAIDSSKTGAGKTVVAIHIAQHFLTQDANHVVLIVCPPTLCAHWTRYVKQHILDKFPVESVEIHSSHSIHKIKCKKDKNYSLIVDECHLFKNTVQRTQKLKRMIQKCKAVLMLSATPYDDQRQLANIKDLFRIQTDIQEHLSSMNFDYSTRTEFQYYHILQKEETTTLYDKGYTCILNSSVRRRGNEEGESVFKPQMFSAGIQRIHDSLVEGAVEYTKKLLLEQPTYKFVVVLNFTRHFDLFQEQLAPLPVLTLNGQTPLEERSRVISKFQRSNLKYRVICISGEVGSVGIELDDKTGSFPRHMIVLPMTNAINFCQAIGRIQRTKTASHSTVSVIQPTRSLTYFKGQIQRKFQTLEQFMHTPDFMDLHQEHKSDCSFKPIEQYVPQLRLPTKAIARIQDFLCHCCS